MARLNLAGFKKGQVTFTGARPSSFSPGNGVTRSFCGRCGSAVAYENVGEPGEIHLHLGLFDDIDRLPDSGTRRQEPR